MGAQGRIVVASPLVVAPILALIVPVTKPSPSPHHAFTTTSPSPPHLTHLPAAPPPPRLLAPPSPSPPYHAHLSAAPLHLTAPFTTQCPLPLSAAPSPPARRRSSPSPSLPPLPSLRPSSAPPRNATPPRCTPPFGDPSPQQRICLSAAPPPPCPSPHRPSARSSPFLLLGTRRRRPT